MIKLFEYLIFVVVCGIVGYFAIGAAGFPLGIVFAIVLIGLGAIWTAFRNRKK